MKFAHIHNTEKGQVLITKEYDPDKEVYQLTIWFPIQDVALGKAEVTIEQEETANEAFENLQDFNILKSNLNTILNQQYL